MGVQFRMAEMRTVAFGSIAAGYSAVGTPLTRAPNLVWFDNLTDANVIISFDGGLVDHLIVPANSGKVVDISTNRRVDDDLNISIGTWFYIKRESAAPTVGNFYLSFGYQR
jgi:hypothetical protein